MIKGNQNTVMAIGGLDPSGGAGILIDSAAVRDGGLHFAGIVTVSTVQNGVTYSRSTPQNPVDVQASIESVMDIYSVVAVKVGAIGSRENVEMLSQVLATMNVPLVLDPVVLSTTGGQLLDPSGLELLIERLVPLVDVLTPNLAEAEILSGVSIKSKANMEQASVSLLRKGAQAVVIKGGHMGTDQSTDLFANRDGIVKWMSYPRQPVGEVRGTGCALASLIATQLGLGIKVPQAVEIAGARLQEAIRLSVHPGRGPRVLVF